MQTIINEILDKFDSLRIEDQESILEIERKRMFERKRKLLVEEVRESEKEYKEGNTLKVMPKLW